MRKLLLILVFVVSSFGIDWAGKVDWAMSYSQAKKVSEKTGKPIFVDLALSHCPPCKWTSEHIYTDEKIASYINKNFISVLLIVDEQKVPQEVAQYFSGYTPSFIILKNGKQITQFSFDREFLKNKRKFIDYLKKGIK